MITVRQPASDAGFTQASTVIAVPSRKSAASATVMSAFVPFIDTAPLVCPAVDQVAFDKVAE
jgi:hypothetical protein